MNYETATHYIFEYPYYVTSAKLQIICAGGEIVDYGAVSNTANFSQLCNYVSNWQGRNLDKVVYGYVYKGYLTGGSYIAFTDNVDWCAMRTQNTYCEFYEYTYVDNVRTRPTHYFNVGSVSSLNYYDRSALTYDLLYNTSFGADLDAGQWCLFDYNYVKDLDYLRTQYCTFYTTILDYYYDNSQQDEDNYTYEIYTGSNLADAKSQSYDNGYNNGQSVGYSNGYNNGFNDGYAQGQAGAGTQETAHAFTYITQAFGAVSNILSIEVLPHVTLGVCFSIPLVIVLIMTIFKLVKK